MDFGLARWRGARQPPRAELDASPTVSQAAHRRGHDRRHVPVHGAGAARGQEADARSDLWALGCVLYEMATGRRAFEGRSQASLISAIMSVEPPPVSQVAPLAGAGRTRSARAHVPHEGSRGTCAQRARRRERATLDRRGRLSGRHARDAVARSSQARAGRLGTGGEPRPAVAPHARSGDAPLGASERRRACPCASRSLLPTQAAFSVFDDPCRVARRQAHCLSDRAGQLAARRCGCASSIRCRRDSCREPRVGSFPFWSPDGRSHRVLRRWGAQEARGGRRNAADPMRRRRAAVAAPGTRMAKSCFAGGAGPIFRVSAAGGEPKPVTTLDESRGETQHRWPSFLPDGRHFLYLARGQQQAPGMRSSCASLDGCRARAARLR